MVQSTFFSRFHWEALWGCWLEQECCGRVDRLPWETHQQFSLSTAQQEPGFSHLHFDISLFRLHWANHALSLLRIPQVVKCSYCKRAVMDKLLKHPGVSKGTFMFVTDQKKIALPPLCRQNFLSPTLGATEEKRNQPFLPEARKQAQPWKPEFLLTSLTKYLFQHIHPILSHKDQSSELQAISQWVLSL